MSDDFVFDGDIAQNQNAISETADFVNQRRITMDRIELQPGERLLEIGAGTGHFAQDLAHSTLGRNELVGIDISEEMLDLARARCADYSTVSFKTADIYELPFDDNSFDVAVSVQTFEYLENVEEACREALRVLRPGGRFFLRDSDWGTLIWNSDDPIRMRTILDAWDKHLSDPYLPRTLGAIMPKAGFGQPRVTGFITCETTFDPAQTSYYIARFVAPFVVQQGVDQKMVDAWLAELPLLSESGRYFYSLSGYIFSARKV